MKLTAQQKRDEGMALNLGELAQISGWGISSLRSMRLPLICGKIRAEDFWRYVQSLQIRQAQPPTSGIERSASPEGNGDLQAMVDKFRAPSKTNVRK